MNSTKGRFINKLFFLSCIFVTLSQYCSESPQEAAYFKGGTHYHTYNKDVSQTHYQAPHYQAPCYDAPHNIFTNNPTNNNNVKGGSSVVQTHQNVLLQNSISQQVQNWYLQSQDKLSDLSGSLLQNKKKIFLTALFASYAYICYQLHKGQALVKNRYAWCNWKQIVSTQHLLSTPYQDLIPELINDIQKKYFFKLDTVNNQSLHHLPIEQFIHDIQQELMILKHYLMLQKIIKTFWASLFFGKLDSKEIVKEKINRLQIISDIFINWQTSDVLHTIK